MTKNQAYKSMQEGNKVCNEHYSPEEYVFINENGLIQAEDGCVMGTTKDEFWAIYQDPEHKYEWDVWIDPIVSIDIESIKRN